MMKAVVTTEQIRRTKLESNHHQQQTITQLFIGRNGSDGLPRPVAQPTVSKH